MININLVVKRAPRLRWQKVVGVVGAVVTVVAVAAYIALWWMEHQRVQQEVAAARTLTEEYRKVAARSGQITEQEELLKRQEAELARITRNQAPYSQAAILAAVMRTAEGIALSDLTFDKDGSLTISGRAATSDSALGYLRRLQALSEFSRVDERRLTTGPEGATFTFSARVQREVKR